MKLRMFALSEEEKQRRREIAGIRKSAITLPTTEIDFKSKRRKASKEEDVFEPPITVPGDYP